MLIQYFYTFSMLTYLLSTRATTKHITTVVNTDKENIIAVIETLWLSELLPLSSWGVIVTSFVTWLAVVVVLVGVVVVVVEWRQGPPSHTYRVANPRSNLGINWLFYKNSFIFPAINPSTVISKYALLSPTHWNLFGVIEISQSHSLEMLFVKASNSSVSNPWV